MKTTILADFFTLKRVLPQLALTALIVGVFIAVFSISPVTLTATLTAVLPMICLMNLCAYDDFNGWSAYRLTLPVTRKEVVWGRYFTLIILIAICAIIGMILGLGLFVIISYIPSLGLAEDVAAAGGFGEMLIENAIEVSHAL